MEDYKQPVEHTRLKQMVQAFIDANETNAKKCKKDRDYFDGNQISEAVLDELLKRGQPPIFTNRVASAVSGMLGILDSGVSDPEAMPRVPRAADAADVVTKTLRYLADRGNYKKARKTTSKEYLVEGTSAIALEWNGRAIDVRAIRWSEFVYDPYSIEYDFTDAQYLGIAKMMDGAEVARMFPETFEALGSPTGDANGLADFFGDYKKSWWEDPKRKRVRVIDLYYVAGGEWHRAIFVASGMLWAGPSDYVDDLGQSMCPLKAVSYEITQEGHRYGAIRNMIPLQDSVNARNSRLLHLVNHRQTRQVELMSPPENKEIARREASKADGTIPFGWEAVPSPDLAQGQMMILQNDLAALDRMAPTPAVLGQVAAANQSGRSRQILQQAGYTELARGFGRFEDFELSVYRAMWCMARQYLTQPEIVRVTDDPRATEFLTINEPVIGPVQVPAMHPVTGEPMIDPYTGQPLTTVGTGQVGVKNRLAELDMDVILTTVPDTLTLEQETFSTLLEYASSNRLSPFSPEFWAMLEMSSLPNKRGTVEKLQRLAQEAQQQQAGAQEAAQEQAQQRNAVELQSEQAKAAKHFAEAEKTTFETEALRGAENGKKLMALQTLMGAQQPYPNGF
jgi:hypothetical protein